MGHGSTTSTKRLGTGLRRAGMLVAMLALLGVTAAQASQPKAGAAPAGLPWPAPKLTNPTIIQLTAKTPSSLVLDPRQDYVLQLPTGHPLNVPHGFSIWGGHNVVMVGGTLNILDRGGVMDLTDQTGTVHIEGVRFTGRRLMEGFDLSEPKGATVEFENVYVSTVHGSENTNHADLIQTWAGPRRLLVDGFVGSTDYQGFFLLPNQLYKGPAPRQFDLRNVFIQDRGGYALWLQSKPKVPLHLSNVFISPNPTKPAPDQWLWPALTSEGTWPGVTAVNSAPGEVAAMARAAGPAY